MIVSCRPQEPLVFLLRQLLLRRLVDLALQPAQPHLADRQSAEPQKVIHRRQHGIDRPQGIAVLQQRVLVINDAFLCDLPPVQPPLKMPHVTEVFLHRHAAFFFPPQLPRVFLQQLRIQFAVFHVIPLS